MTVVIKSRKMSGAPGYFYIRTGRNFNLAGGIMLIS